MYYFMISQKLETNEDLYCKSTNKLVTQSIIVVANDELIEVIAEKFEDDANMLSKNNKIFDSNYI